MLRRSYEIMEEELPDLSAETALQMAVKAVNDTVASSQPFSSLVPTHEWLITTPHRLQLRNVPQLSRRR